MRIKAQSAAEFIFLTFVFFLANIRSTIFWSLYPPVDSISSPGWRETALWAFAMALALYLLAKHNLYGGFLNAWRRNPFLIAFTIFSAASLLWSTAWNVTLQRLASFLFASFAAVFLGVRYSLKDLLHALYWMGAVVTLTGLALALAVPELGRDLNPLYNGAWRGVFWHKNQLGNILPVFNLVFLLYVLLEWKNRSRALWLSVVLYLISLVEIALARSASGYILTMALHLGLGVAALWLRVKSLLRSWHYFAALGGVLAAAAVLLLNLRFVFGLFGKNVTLTGRIPMWGVLFREVFPLHPWLGQGFGTIWADLDFRLFMRDRVGWSYPVLIGDNGFIDILLNLGLIGLALFLCVYLTAWAAAIRYSFRDPALESFFPALFMLYTLLANITFSLFMETEVFIWMVMVSLSVIGARQTAAA
ncbi:MAG: O-antigen ligase family protein [Chloroflexi bacterium]|nr:O-antigen ligase family protein [Chloroflexota bacterium]MCA2002655.1 O-antigen ligase family protein [Chloroflexota bacterium]